MVPSEQELKETPRKPFRCPAWATDGDKTLGCTLVDLSEISAGLVFDKPDGIPENFTLHLKNRQSVSIPCHVIERDGAKVMVAFFARPEPPARKPLMLTV